MKALIEGFSALVVLAACVVVLVVMREYVAHHEDPVQPHKCMYILGDRKH